MHIARLQEEGGPCDLSDDFQGVLLAESTNSMNKAYKKLSEKIHDRFAMLGGVVENISFPKTCSITDFLNKAKAPRKSQKIKCEGLYSDLSAALGLRSGGNAEMKDLASTFVFLFLFGLTKGTSTATARCLWRVHNGITRDFSMPKGDSLNDFLDPHRIVGEQHSTYDTSSDVVSPTNLEFLVETICLTTEVHDIMHAAVYGDIKSNVTEYPQNEEEEEVEEDEEEDEEEEMATKSQLKKIKSEMRKSSSTSLALVVPLMVLHFVDHVINNAEAKRMAHKCAEVFDCHLFTNDCYKVLHLILQVLSKSDLSESHGVERQREVFMSSLKFFANVKNDTSGQKQEFWSDVQEGKYEKMHLLTKCFMTCAETIANRVTNLAQHIRMDDRGEGKARTFAKRLEDRNKRRQQSKGRGTGNGGGRGGGEGKAGIPAEGPKPPTPNSPAVGPKPQTSNGPAEGPKPPTPNGPKPPTPNGPAEGPKPPTPNGHNSNASSDGHVTSPSGGRDGHKLFETYSQEQAQNTFLQEAHEDNEESASKSAVLSNDVGRLQRTRLLSPNEEFSQKSKSVLETLSEGEGWTEPPWAQPDGTYFPRDVQRRAHGAMAHFDCESCVSLYLSFNSGTHYREKSQLAKRLVGELKQEDSHLHLSILRHCQKDPTMQPDDFPNLIESLEDFIWVVLTEFPGLDSWIPALEFATYGKGLPCGHDVGESGHLGLSITDPLNFAVSCRCLTSLMPPHLLPWNVNSRLKAQCRSRMAGSTGDKAVSFLPFPVEHCVPQEARSCLLGGLSFLLEHSRGSPHDEVATTIFDWFFMDPNIWECAWASRGPQTPSSIISSLKYCSDYGERGVHLKKAFKIGEHWKKNRLFYSIFLKLEHGGVHCYSQCSHNLQMYFGQLMLEKQSRPLHEKFREEFNLSHIREERFFDDFHATMLDCPEETEAIRGSPKVEIVLPVVQDEHTLAAGGGKTNRFPFFLQDKRDWGEPLDVQRLVDDWYKGDFVVIFSHLLQHEVRRSSCDFKGNDRIRIGVGLHYLGSEQNEGDVKLSTGLLARARSNILGVQEVADGMKLNCLYDMVICTYNITRYHWLPYTVHLEENGACVTMYDDSSQPRNFDKLLRDWANVFALDSVGLRIVKRPSQRDASSCGPRALLCMPCLAFRRRDGNESGHEPSEVDWWDDGRSDDRSDKIVWAFRRAMIRVCHHLLVNYERNNSCDTVDEESLSDATSQEGFFMSDADSVVMSEGNSVELRRIMMGSQGSCSQESGDGLDGVKCNMTQGSRQDFTDILRDDSSGDSRLKGTTIAKAVATSSAVLPKKRPREEELKREPKKRKTTTSPHSGRKMPVTFGKKGSQTRGPAGVDTMKTPVSVGRRGSQKKGNPRPYDLATSISLRVTSWTKNKPKTG